MLLLVCIAQYSRYPASTVGINRCGGRFARGVTDRHYRGGSRYLDETSAPTTARLTLYDHTVAGRQLL